MQPNIGVVGAGTLLAKEVFIWIEKWHFPYQELYLFDQMQWVGTIKKCKEKYYPISNMQEIEGKEVHLLFICDAMLYEKYKDKIAPNSYCILLKGNVDEHVILPRFNLENNTEELKCIKIPECSTIPVAQALHVLQTAYTLQYISITSMHPVSELDYIGCNELKQQLKDYYLEKQPEAHVFPYITCHQHLPILFHPLPQCDAFLANGSTLSEDILCKQVQYLLQDQLPLYATCIRVDSMRGLSQVVCVKTKEPIHIEQIQDLFAGSSFFVLMDDIEHNMYPMISDVLHDHRTFIGRIRKMDDYTLQFWMVSDDIAQRVGSGLQAAYYIYHNFLQK
ncbi:MAG: hypothetical protein K2L08_03395 [Erysipelotrichaceae bacterium]|nr:hypothetical protein [Erysipelotrichaceae bacterium]